MNASDETHSTPLYLASCRDCKAPDPAWSRFNAKYERQSTPLHLAISSHSDLKGGLVRLLLSHDANLGARDAGEGGGGGQQGGQTPLQIAVALVGYVM
jgi:hypothetical protein